MKPIHRVRVIQVKAKVKVRVKVSKVKKSGLFAFLNLDFEMCRHCFVSEIEFWVGNW